MADKRMGYVEGDLGEHIRSVAHTWDTLDNALRVAQESSGVSVRGIKCLWRGDEWLIIISADVGGQPSVTLRTASSSGDIGRVIRVMLERSDWKPDKFAALDKSKSG